MRLFKDETQHLIYVIYGMRVWVDGVDIQPRKSTKPAETCQFSGKGSEKARNRQKHVNFQEKVPQKHETGRNVSVFRKRFQKSTKPAETCRFWSLRSRQHTITVERNKIIIKNIRKPRAANGEHVIHVRAYQSRGCAPQEVALHKRLHSTRGCTPQEIEHRGYQNRQPRPKRRLFEDVVLVILNPVCKNKPL